MAASTSSDQIKIAAVVTGVSHFIDRRRWPELRALYADTVEMDYTSLFGGRVERLRADKVMENWRALLTPVVTQHLIGPIDVEAAGDSATAACHVRGYHYSKGAPGGDEWMVAGHWVFELAKSEGAWKIQKMKLETFYQRGNTKLLEEAAGARADK